MASNKSPSPFLSRNSETNPRLRKSFNGNSFALTNPTPTPAYSPATADHRNRHSNAHFQDEKENNRTAKSPANANKNFTAPTISAASKLKILGEKNELTRTSVQFSDINVKTPLFLCLEESDIKLQTTPLAQFKIFDGALNSFNRKEIVFEAPPVHQVPLNSISMNDSTQILPEEQETQFADSVKESEVKKARIFTPSKTIPLLLIVFIIACFSISSNDSPPLDFSTYQDFSFSNFYLELNKFAAFAKEKFDGFVECLKQWSNNLISYLKSHFSYKISSVQFSNLSMDPPPHEEFSSRGEIFEKSQRFDQRG